MRGGAARIFGLQARRGGAAAATPAFDPATLFASGEDGAWYDPSDLSTLWQDTGGTVAVTADGDSVARMDDKSGNGNHLTQSQAGRRPVYKTDGTYHWLLYDGVDDILETTSPPPFGASISEFVVAAAMREAVRASAFFWQLETNVRFLVWSDGNLYFDFGGTSAPNRVNTANTATIDTDTVILTRNSVVGSLQEIRQDGVQVVSDASGHTVSDLASNLRLGGVGTNVLNGRIYGCVVAVREFTPAEITDLEEYQASKAGVTL